MTLEEACLIMAIKEEKLFTRENIELRFNVMHPPTKEKSEYLANRIEDAKKILLEELERLGK